MKEKREGWNPLLKSYPQSEKVNALSFEAETLFTRLIAQADDYGNYYGDPKLIISYLFGHRYAAGDLDVPDAARMRDELVSCSLAVRYEVGGKEYLHLVNPHRKIRGDVKPDERFPREPEGCEDGIPTVFVNTARIRYERGPDSVRERTAFVPPTQPNPTQTQPISLHGANEQKPQATSSPAKPKKPTKKEIGLELEQEFETSFWPQVPNKVGHGVAQEAFAKARAKASLDEIVAGLPRYVSYEASRRSQKDYRPLHPSTWLNQERWKDGAILGPLQRIQAATGSGTDYSKLVKGGKDA
jgi:hypothetical protein